MQLIKHSTVTGGGVNEILVALSKPSDCVLFPFKLHVMSAGLKLYGEILFYTYNAMTT